MIVKTIALTLFMFCLWTSQAAQAETAYISDNLRVGVRLEPGTKMAPFIVLTTGEKLTVLENDGKYSLIRTNNGKEGWVRNIYLSETPPAKLLIEEIKADYKKAQDELAHSQLLNQKIKLLNGEILNLQKKMAALSPEKNTTWIYMLIAGISLCGLAFILGILWDKHRVEKKLGGHTL